MSFPENMPPKHMPDTADALGAVYKAILWSSGGMIWPPWTVIRDRGDFWQCLEDGQNHAKGNCVLFQGGGHGGDFCAAHADTGFDANAGIV